MPPPIRTTFLSKFRMMKVSELVWSVAGSASTLGREMTVKSSCTVLGFIGLDEQLADENGLPGHFV